MGLQKTVSFTFLGDLMLGGEFIPYVEKRGMDYLHPFHLIEPRLFEDNILFINLEGPLYQGPDKRSDVTSLLSNHPNLLNMLKGRLCVLNLANNHIMDYGEKGLQHTLMLLKNNGLYYVGAGEDYSDANRELILEYKNKRIAFLAFTSDEPHIRAIIAGPHKAGCASFIEVDKVISKIQKLRHEVDVICVALHWGYEYFMYPSPEQINMAHTLVDAGAHYIIGHHPHVVQGVERFRNSIIIYSLGNFYLPPIRSTSGRLQPRKRPSKEYMLLGSSIDENGNIIFGTNGGIVSEDYLITPYDEDGQQAFKLKIDRLSAPLYQQDYSQFWLSYVEKRKRELMKESLEEAFRKLKEIPFRELMETISWDDVTRNIVRLWKAISRTS